MKESLEHIGGLDVLKSWLTQRREAFGRKAVEYGLPSPKGLLIVGLPGTGKSLTAEATASVFGRPLLKLDAGGSSEVWSATAPTPGCIINSFYSTPIDALYVSEHYLILAAIFRLRSSVRLYPPRFSHPIDIWIEDIVNIVGPGKIHPLLFFLLYYRWGRIKQDAKDILIQSRIYKWLALHILPRSYVHDNSIRMYGDDAPDTSIAVNESQMRQISNKPIEPCIRFASANEGIHVLYSFFRCYIGVNDPLAFAHKWIVIPLSYLNATRSAIAHLSTAQTSGRTKCRDHKEGRN